MSEEYVKPCPKCGATERGVARPAIDGRGSSIGTCLVCKRRWEQSKRDAARAARPPKTGIKPCNKCGSLERGKPTKQATLGACVPCTKRTSTAYYARLRLTFDYRMKRWVAKFGVSREALEALLTKQNGRCACCGDPLDFDTPRKVHLDHDHSTNEIRGFVCWRCNSAVGFVLDSVTRALKLVAYLRGSQPSLPGLAPIAVRLG